MKTATEISTLLVRASKGQLRLLVAYAKPRAVYASRDAERLRWARDVEGGWYSFSRYEDAVIESSSGKWYEIVGDASNDVLPGTLVGAAA